MPDTTPPTSRTVWPPSETPDPGSSTVYIVDDDVWVRRALERLIGAAGYRVSAFGSAAEFVAAHDPDCTGCVILDIAMTARGGLDLQRALHESGSQRAIIFLTACGSIPEIVRAMKLGAVTFLTKPTGARELLALVAEAVEYDRARITKKRGVCRAAELFGLLVSSTRGAAQPPLLE
jgi:FixJ family two-component response regulator